MENWDFRLIKRAYELNRYYFFFIVSCVVLKTSILNISDYNNVYESIEQAEETTFETEKATTEDSSTEQGISTANTEVSGTYNSSRNGYVPREQWKLKFFIFLFFYISCIFNFVNTSTVNKTYISCNSYKYQMFFMHVQVLCKYTNHGIEIFVFFCHFMFVSVTLISQSNMNIFKIKGRDGF